MTSGADVAEAEELPEPLRWEDRAASMIWLPGSQDQILDRLIFFLSEIQADGLDMDEITWPDTGERLTTRNIVGTYYRSGLVRRNSQRNCGLELTADAHAWLESRDQDFLIGILHSRIKFVGELLDYVQDRATHEQLREVADQDFLLGWKTLDQIRRRTTWLRAAGYLELWTNLDLVLTERGRAARDRLVSTQPNELDLNQPERMAVVSDPPPVIKEALQGLSQEALAGRRRAISYIPAGDGIAATLSSLVAATDPSASKDSFTVYCENSFSISASSADSALQTLRSAGLIEQTGPNSFSPSVLAAAWIESDDPLDLIRILHCHFLGLGETLYAATQVDGSGKIARFLSDHFAISDLPVAEVARRVRLLHSVGLLDQVTQFTYRVNALGKALLYELPLLDIAPRPDTAHSGDSGGTWTESPGAEADRRSQAESLASELIEAAFDASHHRRLEAAAAAAFSFMGLGARHLGYSDRTDVLLTAWISPGKSKTLIVDAKAASAGLVEEGRVSFDKLERHRSQHGAEKIVVVGTEFAERVREYAKRHSVTLIRTDDLAAWLRRHADVPMSASTVVSLLEGEDPRSVRRIWDAANLGRNVFAGVIQHLWEAANSDSDIRVSGGALSSRDLWRSLRGEYPDAQTNDIEAALQMLASSLIGAVKATRREGVDFYSMIDPPALVIHKIQSLAATVEPSSPFSGELENPTVDIDGGVTDIEPRDIADRTSGRNADGIDPAVIREWARGAGIVVRDKGRLPGSVMRRYREANGPE